MRLISRLVISCCERPASEATYDGAGCGLLSTAQTKPPSEGGRCLTSGKVFLRVTSVRICGSKKWWVNKSPLRTNLTLFFYSWMNSAANKPVKDTGTKNFIQCFSIFTFRLVCIRVEPLLKEGLISTAWINEMWLKSTLSSVLFICSARSVRRGYWRTCHSKQDYRSDRWVGRGSERYCFWIID